ncbi:ABC transporter ATP-binding protein [Murimonas intestini]|uniref:ATP-binding cassette subfamily B protein n=1 Tax=Murimonas intestini TaxID=1337051 RepID=A0AB73T9Q2_9FIRM|nr:ABC transporter ATP-binding protein/permease [Murimonas intestini]MCR1864591.1 ABC transporter ATP-binding protein/permease [Murimonas intestini]MCR1882201.1 ABC transporter ATP-binding protein/permease [Murimonas intestini]
MGIYGKYFQKYKIPFLTAIFCVSCEAFCDLLGPTLMARIIDSGIERQDTGQVLHFGALMILVTGAGAVFAVIRNILASNVSQRAGKDLRGDLFEKIMHFSEAGADRIESGSLITRMSNDTTQVIQFINGIMRIFMKAPVTCIGSIILATFLNWRLSFIIYGVVAAVAAMIILSMKLSYPRFAVLQKAMDQVNRVVQEYLIGVRLVKAFGTYEEEENQFNNVNRNLMDSSIRAQMIITYIAPILNLTVGIGTAAAVYLGARLFKIELANPGDISAFIIYMAQILSSLLIITNIFNTFVRTKASTQRIKEVLDQEEDLSLPEEMAYQADGSGTGEEGRLKGEVAFSHVTFSYPGGSGLPVLEDVSFHIRPGRSLAVIGPTGSGKSTLAWLLLRFYDADEGEVLLDGTDVRRMDVRTVRQNIALVPQKPMLFSGTVLENLRWGKSDAKKKEAEAALQAAEGSFILQAAEGLDKNLGSAGVNLSGGQKQRVSIARGIIKNAPVLVLDDATSALDAITEARVRKNLLQGRQKRTTVFITQRCTTAMAADDILVLENGRCMGYGTHEELMENCRIYQEIYQSQIEGRR